VYQSHCLQVVNCEHGLLHNLFGGLFTLTGRILLLFRKILQIAMVFFPHHQEELAFNLIDAVCYLTHLVRVAVLDAFDDFQPVDEVVLLEDHLNI